MASARVEGAAKGAQIGGQLGGPVGSGIGAILGGLFGGKDTYAQTTGHRVVGTIGPDGFKGTAYGLAENAGERYQDVLDNRYHFLDVLQGNVKGQFLATFGPDAPPMSIDFTGPADGAAFFTALTSAIREAGPRPSDPAPLSGAKPAGAAPSVMPIGAAGVPVPSTMAPVSILPQPQQSSGGGSLALLALLFGAAYVMR